MLQAGDIAGGRFRLIRPIGAGGMARVWWARHELIGRDVALKLSPASQDDQVVGRFLREAKIIGKFHHRNIVSVVDAGVLEDEGYVFLAMELLRGASLAARLIPPRPLPPEEVVSILVEVCQGLEVAHAAGVVHRDVKPENIFLAIVPGEGIVPKLVDFGISHLAEASDSLTIDGQLLGTPSYMSPEQALGRRSTDARSDLWAVGVILYEALTGKQPFKSESHLGTLRRITDDEPTPLPDTIDPRLRAIIARCLQKERAQRYPDAASLRADLASVLSHRGSGSALSLPGVSARQVRRDASTRVPWLPARWLSGRARRIAGAAGLAAVIAAGVALWGSDAPVSEAALAESGEPRAGRMGTTAKRIARHAAAAVTVYPAPAPLAVPEEDRPREREKEREGLTSQRPHRRRIGVTSPGF